MMRLSEYLRQRLIRNAGETSITPYTTFWTVDNPRIEVQERSRLIAKKLAEYQERMVEYHHARSPSHGRVQLIRGLWDIGTDTIRVEGSGARRFAWEGDVESFLAGGVELEKIGVPQLVGMDA